MKDFCIFRIENICKNIYATYTHKFKDYLGNGDKVPLPSLKRIALSFCRQREINLEFLQRVSTFLYQNTIKSQLVYAINSRYSYSIKQRLVAKNIDCFMLK